MNTQAIFNTIEAQHENYDLELNDKMIMSDLEAASTEIPLTYTEQNKEKSEEANEQKTNIIQIICLIMQKQ